MVSVFESCTPIHFSNSMRLGLAPFAQKINTRNYSRATARVELLSLPQKIEGRGAPKGANFIVSLLSARLRQRTSRSASPFGAPTAGLLAKGPLFRVRDPKAFWTSVHPGGFPAVQPHRVQPLKAEPRSWPGRWPSASRTHGCEPCARAPHPAPHSRRLMKRPSRTGRVEYIPMMGNCQDAKQARPFQVRRRAIHLNAH